MTHRVVLRQRVQIRPEFCVRQLVIIRHEMGGCVDRCLNLAVIGAGAIDLGAVAGRENGSFMRCMPGLAKPGTRRSHRLTKLVGREGHFLAERDGCRGVIEPYG